MTNGTDTQNPVNLEKFSKNKRGRPRKYTEDYLEKMRQTDTNLRGKTDRCVCNFGYTSRAFCILLDRDPNFEKYSWLLGINEHGTGCKHTILSELGRLVDLTGDEQDMIDVVELLCKEKPKTTAILPILRRVRNDIKKKVQQ